MTKHNSESCQAWYQKMRADESKLAAYRKRKRDWQRKNRGYNGQTTGSRQRETQQQEQEQRRESRLQPIHEMASRIPVEPVEDA